MYSTFRTSNIEDKCNAPLKFIYTKLAILCFLLSLVLRFKRIKRTSIDSFYYKEFGTL